MFFKILLFICCMSILLEDILSMEAYFKKVAIDSNFYVKDDITRFIPETICAISCQRLVRCIGYMPYLNSASGCTHLTTTTRTAATRTTVLVEVMWDRMRIHKGNNGKSFTNGKLMKLGYNRNWRHCLNGCIDSDARMAPTATNYNRLKFYHLQIDRHRIWMDGLRQVGEENFYNQKGDLVLNVNTTNLEVNIDGDNTKVTGLAAYWRVVRGWHAEVDHPQYFFLCLCAPR